MHQLNNLSMKLIGTLFSTQLSGGGKNKENYYTIKKLLVSHQFDLIL